MTFETCSVNRGSVNRDADNRGYSVHTDKCSAHNMAAEYIDFPLRRSVMNTELE